jgi:hypothetical protein
LKYRLIGLLLLIALCTVLFNLKTHPSYSSIPVPATTPAQAKILLVPLDGRPPCRKAVIDAAKLMQAEIVAPPAEIQDYYTEPGDTKQLRQWLTDNIAGSKAIILSLDQFLYGGLLASREGKKSEAELQEALSFLQQLHEGHPAVPIYAFATLPRITPPASIDGYTDNKYLLKYSRAVGRFHKLGDPEDAAASETYKAKIDPASLEKYEAVFTRSTALGQQLIKLAQAGIFTRLILGQDDGEKYSIPNIEKESLTHFINAQNMQDKVTITHGADEVALSLLTDIALQETPHRPQIYVEYNDAKTPARIMPYMAVPTRDTVKEKIALMGGQITAAPENADFVLFVSCNDTDTLDSRSKSAARIKALLLEGKSVALVDLSRHFTAEETVFPFLVKNDIPVNALSAYAGWNTASNSIGTALAQAELFYLGRQAAPSKTDLLALYHTNLVILNNRYLEDYYYLKDAISLINGILKNAGYKNVYDLDLEHNYLWCTDILQYTMRQHLSAYKNSLAFRRPFTVQTPEGPAELRVRDLTLDVSFPWPRTFEIYAQTTLWLDELH